MKRIILLALVASLTILSAPVFARDGVVIVTIAGEAFGGGPTFNFWANDQILAARTLTKSVDTTTGETLRFDDARQPPPSEKFTFWVPDIDNVSHLDFEFTNDAWAGEGKNGDRNLYVLGLALSIVEKTETGFTAQTVEFAPSSFQVISDLAQGGAVSAQYAALYHRGRLRLNRPPAGWGASPEPKAASQARDGPINSPPSCVLSPIEIKGFAKNTTLLSPPMQAQLAALAASLKDSSCTATIRAFTAGGSSDAFRAELSLARAQVVAKQLTDLGVDGAKIKVENATGRGRRVVISFD
jgi:outer membrane protein OmpA-like peptidoglycan-associated protein